MSKKNDSAKSSKPTSKEVAFEGAIEERPDGQFAFVCVVSGKRFESDPYPTRAHVEEDIAEISRGVAKLLQAQHGMLVDTEIEFGPLPQPPRQKH